MNHVKCAVEIPTVLTHYFKPGREPFRTLSDLPLDTAVRLAKSLNEDRAIAASRFEDAEKYVKLRHTTEQRLRSDCKKLGMHRRRRNPVYFVLGRSMSFIERYEKRLCWVQVELDALPRDSVSFTYGDSMVNSMLIDGSWPHPDPQLQTWHTQVFRRDSLTELVHRIGLPPEWQPGRDHYVEAQVWTDVPSILARAGSRASRTNTVP